MARPKEVLWFSQYTIKSLFTCPKYLFNRHVNTQDFIIDKLKMCYWTTARRLYILRHNMSKCEYVQVFFTTKENGLILQSVTTGRGELASQPSGNWALKEEGKQTLSIWWASRRSWIQLHILIWTVSQVSPVNKKPVHYCLQDQAPQDNGLLKANKKPLHRKEKRKKKTDTDTWENTYYMRWINPI